MATTDQILSWRGRELSDRDGEKIGKVDEVYLDTTTNQPEWALVNTGLFGRKSTFVPLRDAEATGDEVRVAHTKSHVKDAPGIDADGQLSESEEAALYRHYDLDQPGDAGPDSGLANGQTTRDVELLGDDDDGEARRASGDAVTRSEEELSVGTSAREKGRPRLRKYVETEDVRDARDD
jgi:sporulation protein YlmC with PRC-barrel domain